MVNLNVVVVDFISLGKVKEKRQEEEEAMSRSGYFNIELSPLHTSFTSFTATSYVSLESLDSSRIK